MRLVPRLAFLAAGALEATLDFAQIRFESGHSLAIRFRRMVSAQRSVPVAKKAGRDALVPHSFTFP
jgi:hypothetical protein